MTEGFKELWRSGESAWFEYHCWESDQSADADLWYRSHQQVTIVRPHTLDENDYLCNEDGTPAPLAERLACGQPRTYAVRFEDGLEATVFEDELSTTPDVWYRPNPPNKGADVCTFS